MKENVSNNYHSMLRVLAVTTVIEKNMICKNPRVMHQAHHILTFHASVRFAMAQ